MFSAELVYRTARLNEGALRAARGHFLHLDSSHGPESVVAHGSKAFVTELERLRPDLRAEHLRLWDGGVRAKMEYNLDHVRSKMASLRGTPTGEDVAQLAGVEALAAQVASARALVISAPIWNYGAPWVLKQYFDCVVHPGLTFREQLGGPPRGILGGGRPLVLITSAGGAASKDHLTQWILDVAAMMGFDRPTVVSAPNVAHGDRQAILDGISRDAERAAAEVAQHSPQGSLGPAEEAADADTSAGAHSGEAPAEEGLEGLVAEDWGPEEVLKWLREKGGLSDDALETLEAARPSGEQWYRASEEDWRDEELGLEDADVARLTELQALTRRLWAAAHVRSGGDAAETRPDY